jgi:hypothetical protein
MVEGRSLGILADFLVMSELFASDETDAIGGAAVIVKTNYLSSFML